MTNELAGGLRDQASRRVRRLTTLGIAGATALTAAFSGLAAGSTHAGKAVTKRISPTAKTVTAPVPALTPSGDAAAPQPQAPQPTQVVPAAQPPVAVTGGS